MRKKLSIKILFVAVVLLGFAPLQTAAQTPEALAGYQDNAPPNAFYYQLSDAEAVAKNGCSLLKSEGLLPDLVETLYVTLIGTRTPQHETCLQIAYIAGLNEGEIAKIKASSPGPSSSSLSSVVLGAAQTISVQRPASGVGFLALEADKLFSPSGVNAQSVDIYYPGTGGEILKPVRSIWGWAVTVSYSLLIVVIVLTSLALLVRGLVTGKASITLQNAIPNLVLALVLIPLSYPISGLFIDGITLGTNVANDFFFGPGGVAPQVGQEYNNNDETAGIQPDSIYVDPFYMHNVVGIDSLKKIVLEGEAGGTVETLVRIVTGFYAANLTHSAYEAFTTGTVAGAGGDAGETPPGVSFAQSLSLGGAQYAGLLAAAFALGYTVGFEFVMAILTICFALLVIYVNFKIFWILLGKLATLMLLPALSPFFFMAVSVPGRGTKVLTNYLKTLAAASLTFILAYILYAIILILSSSSFYEAMSVPNSVSVGTNYNPPIITPALKPIMNAIGGGQGAIQIDLVVLYSLLAVVLMFAMPTLLKRVDKALGVEGSGLTEFFKIARGEFDSARSFYMSTIPSTVGTVNRAINRYVTKPADSIYDTFRAPGVPSRQEAREISGAQRLNSANERFKKSREGAPSIGNALERLRNFAGVQAARGLNAVLGETPKLGEGERVNALFKLGIKITDQVEREVGRSINVAKVTRLNFTLTAPKYDLPAGATPEVSVGGQKVNLSDGAVLANVDVGGGNIKVAVTSAAKTKGAKEYKFTASLTATGVTAQNLTDIIEGAEIIFSIADSKLNQTYSSDKLKLIFYYEDNNGPNGGNPRQRGGNPGGSPNGGPQAPNPGGPGGGAGSPPSPTGNPPVPAAPSAPPAGPAPSGPAPQNPGPSGSRSSSSSSSSIPSSPSNSNTNAGGSSSANGNNFSLSLTARNPVGQPKVEAAPVAPLQSPEASKAVMPPSESSSASAKQSEPRPQFEEYDIPGKQESVIPRNPRSRGNKDKVVKMFGTEPNLPSQEFSGRRKAA